MAFPERNERNAESQAIRNPIPFQNEIWSDPSSAALYANTRKETLDGSWKKYVGGSEIELFEGPKPIEFTNHLFAAYERAVAEKKPLVVEFSQESCGYCQKLNKETFRHDAVKALADKAIWVRVDPDKDEDDKGNVGALARQLKVDRYPTTVVIDAKENSMSELGRIVGYFEGEKFADNMKQILPQQGDVIKRGSVVEMADNGANDKRNAA